MVSEDVIEQIDRVIKEIWVKNLPDDYADNYMLKEASLKCCFYYHLRRKLAVLLRENNLRIYSEFYFPELGYAADLAIVEVDVEKEEKHLRNQVTDVVAVIELKYDGGNAERTAVWIKSDIPKIKNYVGADVSRQFYFAVIYETECSRLTWMDKRSTNNWASGRVTELDAGYIDGEMWFEVNPYNGLNPELTAAVR